MSSSSDYMSRQAYVAQLADMRRLAHSIALHTDDGKYQRGDARNAFHIVASNTILYHCITRAALLRTSTCTEPVEPVVGETVVLMGDLELQDQFWGNMRRHLFLDVWCAFEDTLRVLHESVVPQQQRNEDVRRTRHVGVPTIWQRVAEVVARLNSGPSNPRYAALVAFLGSTRNTIHSNSFYKGGYRSLELDAQTRLELVDGMPTDFLSLEKLPRLINGLVEAANYLRQGLASFPRIETPNWIHENRRAVP